MEHPIYFTALDDRGGLRAIYYISEEAVLEGKSALSGAVCVTGQLLPVGVFRINKYGTKVDERISSVAIHEQAQTENGNHRCLMLI